MPEPYLDVWDAHHETVVDRLGRASPEARVAFAASCAEELYPLYPPFAEEEGSGDPTLVREALDAVWRWAETRDDSGVQPAELADRVADVTPRSDESRSQLAPWAQNAALAAVAALEAWAGENVERVAPASERVIEALHYVIRPDDEPPDGVDILEAELERQRRALEVTSADGVRALREEASRGEVAAFVLAALGR